MRLTDELRIHVRRLLGAGPAPAHQYDEVAGAEEVHSVLVACLWLRSGCVHDGPGVLPTSN